MVFNALVQDETLNAVSINQ